MTHPLIPRHLQSLLDTALGEIVGIEVKASATVGPADFKGLRRLAALCRERFRAGAVLYDGEHVLSFGAGMSAVPLHLL